MKKQSKNNSKKHDNAKTYIRILKWHKNENPEVIFDTLNTIIQHQMKSAISSIEKLMLETNDELIKQQSRYCLTILEHTDSIPVSELDFPIQFDKKDIRLIWELLDDKTISSLKLIWNDFEKNLILDSFKNKKEIFAALDSYGFFYYKNIDSETKKAKFKLNRFVSLMEKAGEIKKKSNSPTDISNKKSASKLWIQKYRKQKRKAKSKVDKKRILNEYRNYDKQVAILPKQEINPDVYLAFFISAAKLSRSRGYLVLEENINKIQNPIIKIGFQMMCDGTPPEMLEKYLRSWQKQKIRKTKMLSEFINHSILLIQSGNNPRYIADFYESIYGTKPRDMHF